MIILYLRGWILFGFHELIIREDGPQPTVIMIKTSPAIIFLINFIFLSRCFAHLGNVFFLDETQVPLPGLTLMLQLPDYSFDLCHRESRES
jgi:hypothetical protein